jgi:hypothetical protein
LPSLRWSKGAWAFTCICMWPRVAKCSATRERSNHVSCTACNL